MVSLGGVSLVIGSSKEAGGRLTRLTQNSVSLRVASAALSVRERAEPGGVPAWLPGHPGSVICTWDLRLQEQARPPHPHQICVQVWQPDSASCPKLASL